jgi:hypothetical protein
MVMILTDQPVQNEPAYSANCYFDYKDAELTKEILMTRKYKYAIKYFVIQHAILCHLSNRDSPFYPFVLAFYQKNKEKIIKSIQDYITCSKDESLFSRIVHAKTFQSNDENIFHNYSSDLESFVNRLYELL